MVVPAEAKKVDITQHALVPKHILLSDDEAKQVLSKLNVSINQLPVITATDPMAKAIGAKAGAIVKIERTSPTGKSPYYRRVV
jgi:DNA-directed RNA polymerase subunit H